MHLKGKKKIKMGHTPNCITKTTGWEHKLRGKMHAWSA
jgi:hypothetical protein